MNTTILMNLTNVTKASCIYSPECLGLVADAKAYYQAQVMNYMIIAWVVGFVCAIGMFAGYEIMKRIGEGKQLENE